VRRVIVLCCAAAVQVGCASPPPVPVALSCPVYVRAVALPAPVYPEEAARQGISDTCESRFDIDWKGQPFNLEVRCTHRIFADATEEALRATEFNPRALDMSQLGARCASCPFAYEVTG
jgi:protein TonB